MVKINRKIEILRAKLKEKDKKINELEKKGGRTKLELNIIKNNYEKNKIINGTISSEPKINKSPIGRQNKYRLTTFKRENSKNSNRELIKSPINKENKKNNNTKKLSEKKNIEGKSTISMNNKSFNANKKRLTIMPNNDNKVAKKFNNINLNKYKTENNYEPNNNNMKDYFLQQKFNELIIPKTTIKY